MKMTYVVLMGFAACSWALGQGCVAIRPMSCSASPEINPQAQLLAGQWSVSTSYRYFESFRHFRGDEEEENRIDQGTQVINQANSMDLGLSYQATARWGINLNVPVIYYDRSSLYEHYGNSSTQNPDHQRFHTQASGIGDIRIGSNYWLQQPNQKSWNLNVGLGLKAPTGDEAVIDDFHRRNSEGEDTTIQRPVDQSIQLGDGGWGFNMEIQGFANLSTRTSLYFNGFYLFNPANTNKTLTRGTADNVDPLIVHHSIADQYGARVGVNALISRKYELFGSLGARIEGIPAHDAIGASDGFRRPGYVVSLEPSVTLPLGNVTLTLSVPTALYRNRVKSTYDLSDPRGQRHGDAAFADYLINFNFSYRIPPRKKG